METKHYTDETTEGFSTEELCELNRRFSAEAGDLNETDNPDEWKALSESVLRTFEGS